MRPGSPYAGLVTRATALGVDAALANVIVLIGGAMLALVGTLAGGLELGTAGAVAAAAVWAAVLASYFVTFWSTTGQTPGMRMMGVRVVARDGSRLSVRRSIVRLVGLVLAIVPLFAGFLPVLFDARRRALQDLLAGTVVVYDEPGSGEETGVLDAELGVVERARVVQAPETLEP